MISACGSTNPYGIRVNIKRKLFSKRKTHSTESSGGIDLKKVKGKHCVETWASAYDTSTGKTNSLPKIESQDKCDSQKGKSNLSEVIQSDRFLKLQTCSDTQLVLSVDLNNEKECKLQEKLNVSR